MLIGVNLPNYSSLGNRDSVTAIAQAAEALGYASLWTSDHVLLPTSLPEPFGHLLESLTTLSYLAARTDHIQLGTGILVLPQRDPPLVAKQAATMSHLSGGRLALAVGVGWIKQEYAYLRADFGNRGRLADEYIKAMRELFESDTPQFHGPHINYSDVLFSPRPSARLPILIGGNSPAALKRVPGGPRPPRPRPPRPRGDPHFDDYALPSIRHDYVFCVTPWTAGLADDPG